MKVIGFSGQMRAGKDTAADYLAKRLAERGEQWQRTAFAKQVKRVYADSFDRDYDFIEEWKVKPECPEGFTMPVRQALQFIGDGFRKIRPTIWIDLAFRGKEPRILSDVRYENEFIRVHEEGGMNILVGRPEMLNDDPNASEAQIKPYVVWALENMPGSGPIFLPEMLDHFGAPPKMRFFHYFVRNDGTLDQLYERIDDMIEKYLSYFNFNLGD